MRLFSHFQPCLCEKSLLAQVTGPRGCSASVLSPAVGLSGCSGALTARGARGTGLVCRAYVGKKEQVVLGVFAVFCPCGLKYILSFGDSGFKREEKQGECSSVFLYFLI